MDARPASYKVALPLDQQTFVSNESLTPGEQMELFDDHAQTDDRLKIAGLDHLSDAAFNALEAVKKLLAKTDYEGNTESEEINSKTFGRITPPRLQIKKSEYFEAYGLEKDPVKGYTGSDKLHRAIQGLFDLTYTQHLLIRQRVWIGREARNDLLKIHSPLITIIEGYELLTDREADAVEAGEEIGKDSRLVIELSPVFVLGLDNFFLLRRYDKRDTIKALAGSSSPLRQKLYRFTNWLEELDMASVPIKADNLARIAGYTWMVKKRERTRLADKIEELLELAKDGGWLLDWSCKNGKSERLYTLNLNPEFCRITKKK